jgi:hypothetical protein
VSRDYATVITRARELRSGRKLPDTLDARLWSLGEAEREVGYREAPYACQCVDHLGRRKPCGPGFEASLALIRREAARKLQAAGYAL